eukprot:scaffold13412_cov47-Attheya_sp.AAC.1
MATPPPSDAINFSPSIVPCVPTHTAHDHNVATSERETGRITQLCFSPPKGVGLFLMMYLRARNRADNPTLFFPWSNSLGALKKELKVEVGCWDNGRLSECLLVCVFLAALV